MKKVMKKVIKKAQNGAKATKDSTAHFTKVAKENYQKASDRFGHPNLSKEASKYDEKAFSAQKSALRQLNKGKSGYDKNGYPIKKK